MTRKLNNGQKRIVKVIRDGRKYEEVMLAITKEIGHHVYEYVKVEDLIEIIRRLVTKP